LNRVRKADDPITFASKTRWRQYKTARATGAVAGSVSVVGYYRDKYVQEAAWRLVNGESPEDVRDWLRDENNVPHQKAISIILQLNEERLEFLKSGLGGYTSRTGTEAKSFYDMDGLSLLKSISTPTPESPRISSTSGRRKASPRSRVPKGRRSRGNSRRPTPWCSRHKKRHFCQFTRKR